MFVAWLHPYSDSLQHSPAPSILRAACFHMLGWPSYLRQAGTHVALLYTRPFEAVCWGVFSASGHPSQLQRFSGVGRAAITSCSCWLLSDCVCAILEHNPAHTEGSLVSSCKAARVGGCLLPSLCCAIVLRGAVNVYILKGQPGASCKICSRLLSAPAVVPVARSGMSCVSHCQP
jgi:hypothetical protein